MAPNERVRRNHDELFPGHVSTLAVTGPELIELVAGSGILTTINQEY